MDVSNLHVLQLLVYKTNHTTGVLQYFKEFTLCGVQHREAYEEVSNSAFKAVLD